MRKAEYAALTEAILKMVTSGVNISEEDRRGLSTDLDNVPYEEQVHLMNRRAMKDCVDRDEILKELLKRFFETLEKYNPHAVYSAVDLGRARN